MSKSELEKKLLSKLRKGELDGQVGDDFTTDGGSTVWTIIEKGKAIRKKQGPTKRFFNGKENERIPGKLHTLETWETEDEMLGFMRKFGWLTKDKDAQAYSAKFKPKKGGDK